MRLVTGGLIGNANAHSKVTDSEYRRPKAAEDCRTPRRFATPEARFLDCASPLALWSGRAEPKTTMCLAGGSGYGLTRLLRMA
jgi:hypothetical protein